MNIADNFTAVNIVPWKLLRCKNAVFGKKVMPVHIQLIPTNKCNRNCKWCSCSEVERDLEFDIVELECILKYFYNLGTQAVTITGGGEPTVYPYLPELFRYAQFLNFKIGLVTNGVLWGADGADIEDYGKYLTWVRVSIDDAQYGGNMGIVNICAKLPKVDIGLTYTVSEQLNMDVAKEVCKTAEQMANITHIRFVQDILEVHNPKVIENMDTLKATFTMNTKTIFQYRNNYTPGCNPCLVSKLRPVINPDGYIYPCCGAQYATYDRKRMPPGMKMCYWENFESTGPFDGRKCAICYYNHYNDMLHNLICEIKHEEFI